MSHKLLTLGVRGLNSSRKRRQVFRWLHLQRSDIIFLQETYSSTETIKRWEAEWGGKVVASHGTTHSKGVMVLFKPNLNVTINKTLADKNGRYILAETSIYETNIVFVNIYAPNNPSQQILFLRDLSSSVLSAYANENLVQMPSSYLSRNNHILARLDSFQTKKQKWCSWTDSLE